MQRVLYLQVLDYDRFSRNDPIGEVSIPLNKVDLTQMQTFWKDLKPCSDGSVRRPAALSPEQWGQGWQRVPDHSQPWDGSRTQSGPLMGSRQRAHSHPWLEGWALEVGGESPAPGNEPMALFRELGALGQHRPARGEEMA